jgi:hypothetical protein
MSVETMKLEVAKQSKLVHVAYLRGLKFVAAEVKLAEDAVFSAMKGEDRPEIEVKKISHWLEAFVS